MIRTSRPEVVVFQQPTRTEYVDRHIEITEKRAPTDESVELLREMEAKAEAEVIKAVSVANNDFSCAVHQSLDHLSDQMRWRAIFKLNGKQMTAMVDTDPRKAQPYGTDAQDNFAALRDEMAKVIATEVLSVAFMACLRSRWDK